MKRYIMLRAGQALVVLLIVASLAFALVRLIPGDPAAIVLGPERATPHNVALLRHQLGLDQPLLSEYISFISHAATLNFGESLTQKESVTAELSQALLPSLRLIVYAYMITILVVIPLAVAAAVRRNRPADHAIRLASTVAFATPPFLSGLALALVFSVGLGWFPVSGADDGIRSYVLPAVTVALFFAPAVLRVLRSSLVDTLGQEFVEAARARGLSRGRVLFKHALRNSALPTVTVLGLSVGALLSADVIVENVFSIPGLGSLLVSAVSARDYPTVQALVVIFATVVVLSSLVTDLLYLVIDPRIRL